MTKLSEKDLALFRGMEAEYGYVAVKDMVAIVSEEMDLSPVEMQVEVRRRLEDQRRSSRRDEDNRRQSEVDRRLEEERKRISEQSQRDQVSLQFSHSIQTSGRKCISMHRWPMPLQASLRPPGRLKLNRLAV